MDRIRIRGGQPLEGTITIGGAKNAALPLMAASLLSDKPVTLENVPRLADIRTMVQLLAQHGSDITESDGEAGERHLHLDMPNVRSTLAPYDLVRKMRASILVLGPLLARCGEAAVSLPGGCAIGTRPVDLHTDALARMGATIELEDGYIRATAPKGLTGTRVVFPKISVGATENVLMAASLAKGETVIVNAAREPEVTDLAHCLAGMGVPIEGVGTDTMTVQGVAGLHPVTHRVVPDRIEAGTYAMAAAITGGDVLLAGVGEPLLEAAIKVLERAGIAVDAEAGGLRVRRADGTLVGTDMMTEPFPGFPTDLQAQFMALMSMASGAAMITETIFENRFMHVPELSRMGADITVHGSSALVRGIPRLTGAPVMATDLRASVSLVLAGLAAAGDTVINRVYHLDRGYERLVRKLAGCGADIERLAGH